MLEIERELIAKLQKSDLGKGYKEKHTQPPPQNAIFFGCLWNSVWFDIGLPKKE